jgi:RNA polymerase sigma-70 factor (family 1)
MYSIRSEAWFRKVFDEHYQSLRNYLFYLSGDTGWSDDAVQQVFLVVWEKRNSLREGNLQPFLFKVARNLFLKEKRRERVMLRFDSLYNESDGVFTPEEIFLDRESDSRLQKAMSELPEKCRTVFLMSRIDEMTNQQLANAMGISVKAIEKHITKALKLLRRQLVDDEGEVGK